MKALPAIFISSLIILLVACGKDKFETKPKLEIKDYSTKELFQGQDLRIRLNYFDKEGDLGDGAIVAIRRRLNALPLGLGDADLPDTFPNQNNPIPLPEFPDRETGEIRFQLNWDRLKESFTQNDTVIFRFAVADKAGNKSDTIESEQIVIRLP